MQLSPSKILRYRKEQNLNFSKKASEKLVSSLNVAIIIVFAGIILTFLTMMAFTFGYSFDINQSYHDGVTHDQIFLKGISDLFYKNANITDTVNLYEYKLFASVSGDEVICGKDGFLFEVRNRQTGYDFWKDHSGNLKFTEDEITEIAAAIKETTERCQKLGIAYYIAVIPNSQTVYSGKLPSGVPQSFEPSRRSTLITSLQQLGITNITDTTEILSDNADDYLLFNNTENSLTPLGAFFAYKDICEDIQRNGTKLLLIDTASLKYQLHLTKSRDLAIIAGVAEYTDNVTVSLTDRMTKYYVSEEINGSILTKNTMYPVGSEGPRVLVSSNKDNDRSAFLYFFASSFGECMIEYGKNVSEELFNDFSPEIYIQIIHENELGLIKDAVTEIWK